MQERVGIRQIAYVRRSVFTTGDRTTLCCMTGSTCAKVDGDVSVIVAVVIMSFVSELSMISGKTHKGTRNLCLASCDTERHQTEQQH